MPDDTEYRYSEEFFRELNIKTKSFTTGTKTVGTSAVELCVGTSPLTDRIRMKFYVEGNEPIYIGGSGVTTSDGYVVLPGKENEETFIFDYDTVVNIYAIASVEGVTVRIREEG